VTEGKGWQPLSPGRRVSAAQLFEVSPFSRLARVHAMNVATDTFVATALAGSLFFSIPTGEARGKVALYLLLTIAPFAFVAPLIGPAIDRARGGRRLMLIVATASRALVCAFMASHVNDLLLFPCAFALLVAGKGYSIAKSALVPTVVNNDEELVRANARLSLISGVIGFVVVGPAALLVKFAGPEWALIFGAITSSISVVLATRLPPAAVAPEPEGTAEQAELRGTGVVLAAEAMGLLRGMVGFLTFMVAFDLRGGGNDGPIPVGLAVGRGVRSVAGFAPVGTGHPATAPAWHFGVVAGAAVLGGLLGALIAPRLRAFLSEERILLGTLLVLAAVGLVCAVQGGLLGAAVIALSVGTAASVGRLAFDSIIQRDAPDANFGRSFARFETRFQLVWVIGSFIPVVVPIPSRIGFLVIAVASGFAAFAYSAGQRRAAARGEPAHGPATVSAF
jgi:MFS family permease